MNKLERNILDTFKALLLKRLSLNKMILFDTEFVLKDIRPKQLSKDFHKAFELRQLTDYKTFKPLSRERAEDILVRARNFIFENFI